MTIEAGRGTRSPSSLIAGVATLLIALVHVGALFVGPDALAYLDAPDLAVMMRAGSPIPIVATLGAAVVFLLFSAYGFAGAGVLRPLPKLRVALAAIGGIFVLRGLGIIWFTYLVVVGSPDAIPREIGFSAVALAVGVLFLIGRRGCRER
jgi:hypothetical protein